MYVSVCLSGGPDTAHSALGLSLIPREAVSIAFLSRYPLLVLYVTLCVSALREERIHDALNLSQN